jgi:hypothetical protein
MSSIFVNQAGEWKLGNVEHMAGLSEGDGVPIKILSALEKYLVAFEHVLKDLVENWDEK